MCLSIPSTKLLCKNLYDLRKNNLHGNFNFLLKNLSLFMNPPFIKQIPIMLLILYPILRDCPETRADNINWKVIVSRPFGEPSTGKGICRSAKCNS